jgi:LacI family transcriptional regulator
MGAAAMTALLAQVEGAGYSAGPGRSENGRAAGLETLVPCRLVIRESTGPAPRR